MPYILYSFWSLHSLSYPPGKKIKNVKPFDLPLYLTHRDIGGQLVVVGGWDGVGKTLVPVCVCSRVCVCVCVCVCVLSLLPSLPPSLPPSVCV